MVFGQQGRTCRPTQARRPSWKEPDDSYLPGIDADLLAPIEDNSVLRVAENEAWQTILGLLQETSQKENRDSFTWLRRLFAAVSANGGLPWPRSGSSRQRPPSRGYLYTRKSAQHPTTLSMDRRTRRALECSHCCLLAGKTGGLSTR